MSEDPVQDLTALIDGWWASAPICLTSHNGDPALDSADLARALLDAGVEVRSPSGRVEPDSYIVYPRDYDLIPYADRDAWALTVSNGHSWGWAIRPGLGMQGSVVLNERGERVVESRGGEDNRTRRWSREEALRIALSLVDSHRVAGMSAEEAIRDREAILKSFGDPR